MLNSHPKFSYSLVFASPKDHGDLCEIALVSQGRFDGAGTLLSVIIPAHNEEKVIGRCLKRLTQGMIKGEADIIVVCNGCMDRTAEIAATYPFVRVISIEKASKTDALNKGDQIAANFPIAYIDADVEITRDSLITAANELSNPSFKIVAPKLEVDLSKSTRLVKSFYKVWTALPYFAEGQTVGSGVFILSEEARKQFGEFPDILADDGYARAQFKPSQRHTVPKCSFKIYAPRTIKDLIRIKTRVSFGNMELVNKYPNLRVGGENTFGSILSLIAKKPSLLVSTCVYIYVQLQTRIKRSQRMRAGDFKSWERDDSSRRI